MAAVEHARVPLQSAHGAVVGWLRVRLLPGSQGFVPHPLLDLSADVNADPNAARVQLLEGVEYGYEWDWISDFERIECEPAEIFFPDDQTRIRGRLRPGLNTGSLDVRIFRDGVELGALELEVRSRKLDYLSEYRWMLRDIATQVAEFVMQRFGASSLTFSPDSNRDAVTLYQRFAFLKAMFSDEAFQRALSEISRRPYVSWEEHAEIVRAGAAIRATRTISAQISRSGQRTAWPNGMVSTLPASFESSRTEATLDNIPNRFVRFALERWRSVVAEIHDSLACSRQTSTSVRGQREAAALLIQLSELLSGPVLRDVRALSSFPGDNQVLHKRAGYREVSRSYLEFELAAQIAWSSQDSRFHAGQRDVAELYEYWCFLTLAKIVGESLGQPLDLLPLLRLSKDRLDIALGKGKEVALYAQVLRGGRKLSVELWFNRTFEPGAATGSWSVRMRPDISLVISACEDSADGFVPVVIHFDAKYRLEGIDNLFGRRERASPNDVQPLREDLLKMHAYRDAVRRSVGAYVLYPGTDESPGAGRFREYDELLPGLGAFTLRPTHDGPARGSRALCEFLDQVLVHFSLRLSRHERARYWVHDAYTSDMSSSQKCAVFPQSTATVLLGFVKSTAHWDWILKRKGYNVRAPGRSGGLSVDSLALYSTFLLLYGPGVTCTVLARIVSPPVLVSYAEMVAAEYPEPRGDYYCVQLTWDVPQDWVRTLDSDRVLESVLARGRLTGEPTQVCWSELESLRPSREAGT